MAHKHDWFDDYLLYSMLNSGGGDNGGCLFALLVTGGVLIFLSAIFYIITY